MRCPRCHADTTPLSVSGVVVDACADGCGGVWFDQHELRRVDERHEDASPLLAVRRREGALIDLAKRLTCPRCEGQAMMRHFFTTRHEVEVDECPACAGFWLDADELARIRSLFATQGDADAAARAALQRDFGAELDALASQGADQARRAARVRSLFRFLCPSAIFGDQRGAA